MPEALLVKEGESLDLTAAAAYTGGQVIQLGDGRAAVMPVDIASGALGSARVEGVFKLAKTANIVLLRGQEVWWDHSANSVTYNGRDDKDFIVGVVTADATAAATTVNVALNVKPACVFDAAHDPARTVIVLTAGTPNLIRSGGSHIANFSATAEAQKVDIISDRSVPFNSEWILEAVVTVITNADADVGDLNVGVANATHASDADSITESVFAHFDMGADLNLDAESDDGTTEVTATDTTVDWAVGTPVHILIDGRTHTDIQIYINGALVLGSTVFTLAAATGPIKALFHLEKSSNDSPGSVALDRMRLWIAEQPSNI